MPAPPGGNRPRRGKDRAEDPVSAKVLHKRDFIGRVAEAAELPRARVRDVVEITLAELGRAIAAGETLALPPFGKARVSRQKTVRGGEVLVVRLRRKADDDDDDQDDD